MNSELDKMYSVSTQKQRTDAGQSPSFIKICHNSSGNLNNDINSVRPFFLKNSDKKYLSGPVYGLFSFNMIMCSKGAKSARKTKKINMVTMQTQDLDKIDFLCDKQKIMQTKTTKK